MYLQIGLYCGDTFTWIIIHYFMCVGGGGGGGPRGQGFVLGVDYQGRTRAVDKFCYLGARAIF